MAARWDQGFIMIVPLWFRLLALLAGLAAASYLAVEDHQPFRWLWLTFSSYTLGFVVTWLLFLAPTLVVIWAVAYVLHARRRRQDFPKATVVDRK